MMKVKNIKYISVAAKEAEMTISDGANECLVFSQPCSLKVGEVLFEAIKVLSVEDLMKVIDPNKKELIKKDGKSYFSYHCVAKVIDRDEGMVSVGDIKFELESKIPRWANKGDLVEFSCSRLDVW